MSDPPGQIRTEIPAGGERGARVAAISAGREVEQGARSVLILAEGLFRLDVIPYDDMVRTVLRNLSPGSEIELRLLDVGGSTDLLAGSHEATTPSTGRFGGEVVLIDADGEERIAAKVLVGSVCHLDRGLTSFTAQATLLCG